MRICLTGGAGFIGKYLCKELKDKNHNVVVYDLIYGDDIRDKLKLDKLFEAEQFDAVIHLAALAGVRRSKEYPDEYVSTNITGTKNVIDMAKKYGVDKFIFYSSSSVLGGCDVLTQDVEKSDIVYYEDNKLKDFYKGLKEYNNYDAMSLYAMTKVTGEFLVKNSGLNYFIVRPFTVYGEEGRSDMVIYKWIHQIKSGKPITFYGKGDTKRGYTHVEDLVWGTMQLLNKDKNLWNEIVHLGGAEIVTLQDLFEIFFKYCQKKDIDIEVDYQDKPQADAHTSFADISKAKEMIGFNPKPRFEDEINTILKKELKSS